MGSIYKLIAAAALSTVAILLHTFYIGYQTNADTYIVSWTSPSFAHNSHLELVARTTMKPERRYARYGRKEPVVYPEITYEQAMEIAKAKYPSTRHGMVPSWASAGRGEPSRAAMSKSLWLGLVLPGALLFGALALLVSAIQSRRQANQTQPTAPKSDGVLASYTSDSAPSRAQPTAHRKSELLADALKARFGEDLGVGPGRASREAPLIITEKVDYVSIEYAAAKFLMEGMEWKKQRQALRNLDGRFVDELTFSVRKLGEQDWSERKFYFDITEGYRSKK